MEEHISELAEALFQGVVSERIPEDAVDELARILAEDVVWPRNSTLEKLGQYLHSLWHSGALEGMPWEFTFQVGRLCALTDLLKLSEERKADEEQLLMDAKRYLNRRAIFRVIAEEQGVRHGELAEKVGLSGSSLSQFMNRIAGRKYIFYRKSGRTKYYFLSEDGRALLEKMEELY